MPAAYPSRLWKSVRTTQSKQGTKPQFYTYLKLVFDLAGVSLGVQPADVVVERAELTHGDGGVAAEACFQDGVMHKHILLLQGQGEGERAPGKSSCLSIFSRSDESCSNGERT